MTDVNAMLHDGRIWMPGRDIAEFKRVGVQQIVDGRQIWIMRAAWPRRGQIELESMIPEPPFTVSITFYSTIRPVSNRDIAFVKNFLSTYESHSPGRSIRP